MIDDVHLMSEVSLTYLLYNELGKTYILEEEYMCYFFSGYKIRPFL